MNPYDYLKAVKVRSNDCRSYNFGLSNADTLAHDDAPRMLDALWITLKITEDHWSWLTRNGLKNECVCDICRLRRGLNEKLEVEE